MIGNKSLTSNLKWHSFYNHVLFLNSVLWAKTNKQTSLETYSTSARLSAGRLRGSWPLVSPVLLSCPSGLSGASHSPHVRVNSLLFCFSKYWLCTDPLVCQQMVRRKMKEVWTGCVRSTDVDALYDREMQLCEIFCACVFFLFHKLTH